MRLHAKALWLRRLSPQTISGRLLLDAIRSDGARRSIPSEPPTNNNASTTTQNTSSNETKNIKTMGRFADRHIVSAVLGHAADKKPNVVILMTDDTGWSDFGYISGGGATLGHPTPNVDRLAKEGTYFTSWYGQASCTAGRSSFITGRIPIRSALSVVVVPGDRNGLRKETPTIAEFFKKNGYGTYFSGKWHLGDVQKSIRSTMASTK